MANDVPNGPSIRYSDEGFSTLIFAIGDIHGCASELKVLLNKLPLTPESVVVFLGDYIDRGHQSKQVLDTVLELQDHCHVVPLMGNHEAMFLDFLDHPGTERAGLFVCNGGSATLASYSDDCGNYDFPAEHVEFLRSLRLTYEDEHYFFVHAGVPDVPLCEIDPREHWRKLLWLRGSFLESQYDWGKVIVHGHTPVREVEVHRNRINLDTGCVFMRHLSAIALPGQQIFTVPRQPVEKRIYLNDVRSRRVAIRFRGTLPVTIFGDNESFDFETIDYSEVGLYLREASGGPSRGKLAVGDALRGRIGSDDLSSVVFTGIVVRAHGGGQEPASYAVQVSSMTPVADTSESG